MPQTNATPFSRDDLAELERLIDRFVSLTIEAVCSADSIPEQLRADPDQRTRTDQVIARLGDVEELMARVRATAV